MHNSLWWAPEPVGLRAQLCWAAYSRCCVTRFRAVRAFESGRAVARCHCPPRSPWRGPPVPESYPCLGGSYLTVDRCRSVFPEEV